VVVLAARQAEQVFEVAKAIGDAEDRIRAAAAAGERLADARLRMGYHTLQTPSEVR
jgi:regulator of RNase E activity RraA